jgi:hypothetical protein
MGYSFVSTLLRMPMLRRRAYAQSPLGGAPTWVSLPRKEWPKAWQHVRRPVCLLEKALRGHPHAGAAIGDNVAIIISKIADLAQ